jgi:hypothetical protein
MTSWFPSFEAKGLVYEGSRYVGRAELIAAFRRPIGK